MRTSTEIGFDAPMRVISPYSTARSSRSCAGDRQGPEFVEEQGAAVGFLEAAVAGLGGAGEAARFVAEQLGLDQVFRQRRAVHDDQRPRPARRQMVEALGDQLLAGAALADHQHRPVERRGAARPLDRVEKGQALPDELIRPAPCADCWWQIPSFGKDFHADFAAKNQRILQNSGVSANLARLLNR